MVAFRTIKSINSCFHLLEFLQISFETQRWLAWHGETHGLVISNYKQLQKLMEVDNEQVKRDSRPPESSTSRTSCQDAMLCDTARFVSHQNGGKFVSHSQLWVQIPLTNMWQEISKMKGQMHR
jgi:hypothetical protein